MPDCSPPLFHCGSGHWCTFRELLETGLPPSRPQPEEVLRSWEDRARVILDLARHALTNGQLFAAADLHDAAHRLAQRVQELRHRNLREFDAAATDPR